MYTTQPSPADKSTIQVAGLKPRNKQLNDALLSRRGGRLKSKKDRDRAKEKLELRRLVEEL